MNNANYAEYTVTQKPEGKYLKRRMLFFALCALLIVGYIALMVALSTYGVLVVILTFPFIPLLTIILRSMVWNRYIHVEHKYEVASAKITFTEIHGKKEDVVFEKLVSAFSLIAPVSDEYAEQYKNADVTLDFRSSEKSPDSYFLLLEEEGKKTVVFFEATTKAVKVMSFYNSKHTVLSDKLSI